MQTINLLELNLPDNFKNDVAEATDILLSKYGGQIKKVILFGSFATGEYQPDSDIDLCIVLDELPPKKERMSYKHAVQLDNREVDLLYCTKDQLDSNILVYRWINEEGIVIYE